MDYPYTKNFFYKSPWRTSVYIDQYSQRSLYHTHVYHHAWWRHYSDNGARGHEYIWTLKHTESSLVFLVWSGVSMIELNQYHASEYNQSYYIWFLQANSGFVIIITTLHIAELTISTSLSLCISICQFYRYDNIMAGVAFVDDNYDY